MKGLLAYDNIVFQTLLKIVNMVVLSAMWIIFCIPVFTAGASTTALYYSVQKWLRWERGYPWTCFWDSFKENFKQSTLASIPFLIVGAFVLADLRIISYMGEGSMVAAFKPFLIVLFVIMSVYAVWTMASIARFENTTGNQLRNAARLMIRHLPVSLWIAFVGILSVVVVYIGFYFILFVPVLGLWLMGQLMERVFRKYMTDEDKRLEDERNQVYRHDYKS